MNHNQTLNEPLIWRMHLWWFSTLGWDKSMFLREKFCAVSCGAVAFFRSRAEGLKKTTGNLEKTEGTCNRALSVRFLLGKCLIGFYCGSRWSCGTADSWASGVARIPTLLWCAHWNRHQYDASINIHIIYVYIYMCIYIYVYIYVYMCIYMYICVNIYMYIYMYICVYICIYV